MRVLPQPVVAARGGLGDAARRLGREPVRIAYLGASVTAQEDGYRTRLHERLRSRHGALSPALRPGSEVTVSLTDTVPDYSSLRAPIDPPERRGVRVIGYLEAP